MNFLLYYIYRYPQLLETVIKTVTKNEEMVSSSGLTAFDLFFRKVRWLYIYNRSPVLMLSGLFMKNTSDYLNHSKLLKMSYIRHFFFLTCKKNNWDKLIRTRWVIWCFSISEILHVSNELSWNPHWSFKEDYVK